LSTETEPTIDAIEALIAELESAATTDELEAAALAYRLTVTPKVVGSLCALVRVLAGDV
jgi:hypothetical protein